MLVFSSSPGRPRLEAFSECTTLVGLDSSSCFVFLSAKGMSFFLIERKNGCKFGGSGVCGIDSNFVGESSPLIEMLENCFFFLYISILFPDIIFLWFLVPITIHSKQVSIQSGLIDLIAPVESSNTEISTSETNLTTSALNNLLHGAKFGATTLLEQTWFMKELEDVLYITIFWRFGPCPV